MIFLFADIYLVIILLLTVIAGLVYFYNNLWFNTDYVLLWVLHAVLITVVNIYYAKCTMIAFSFSVIIRSHVDVNMVVIIDKRLCLNGHGPFTYISECNGLNKIFMYYFITYPVTNFNNKLL